MEEMVVMMVLAGKTFDLDSGHGIALERFVKFGFGAWNSLGKTCEQLAAGCSSKSMCTRYTSKYMDEGWHK